MTNQYTQLILLGELVYNFYNCLNYINSKIFTAYLPIDDKNVEQILSWKFITLDKDGDGYLDRAEYKELRRLAKKAVRPKKCARTFARTCDLDRDLKLSRQEWGACLTNDFTRKLYTYILHVLVLFILEWWTIAQRTRQACQRNLFKRKHYINVCIFYIALQKQIFFMSKKKRIFFHGFFYTSNSNLAPKKYTYIISQDIKTKSE